jgi:succinate dehydrogenase / fumarate reductase membrane anchor subunit
MGMRETKYWTWHMAAGIVILVLLGLHMTTMHMGGLTGLFVSHPGEEATALINSQARDARLSFAVGYIVLLGVALFHGFYGLRTILFELTLRPVTEKVITIVLVVAGLGLFGLGSWASLAAHARAIVPGG